ncbi:MAG TPA: hypothetical protein VFK06_22065 [Candidatus Angelobacter sp.]|nr:hypothetical protein [Candidatus Angelobacter sp.]
MAWPALANRLQKLPLVLAGPILREVTANSVTVWVALQKAADVTLVLYVQDVLGPRKLTDATRSTAAVGTNLHMVAVTVQFSLSVGTVYLYDLVFQQDVSILMLADATQRPLDPNDPFTLDQPPPQSFAYAPYSLPSFVLPPTDPNKVRIFHGSCRKAHGEGEDALAILDDLIAAAANSEKLEDRPHLLLMTGDQIYADEVADALLIMLTDAAHELLGWLEVLPTPDLRLFPPSIPEDLPPFSRKELLKRGGFKSQDLRSHLMSMGEYVSMYLFAWSDVLWPRSVPGMDTIPTFLDIFGSVSKRPDKDDLEKQIMDKEDEIAKQSLRLRHFRDSLPKVRKALANIPTYMICDDHEVTDDWNMTRGFCEGVYGSPLGVRVMQNALVAFAICQAWGNQPQLFDPGIHTRTPPFKSAGARLLELLPTSVQNSDEVRKIVGVHTADELTQKAGSGLYRVFHESNALRYDFKIDFPAFVIIVTDTRTWRSFPESGRETQPDMLDPGELANQLTLSAPTDKPKLIVFTTNAPPIRAMRKIALHPHLADVYGDDIYDSWQFPWLAFDRMIVQLTKMCPVKGEVIKGQVVILSGDYHYCLASRLDYWADTRLEQTLQPANLVVGQLVASPFKNESESTRAHQEDGYTYHRHSYESLGLPVDEPEGYAGWNYTTSGSKRVGEFTVDLGTRLGSSSKELTIDKHSPTCDYDLAGNSPLENISAEQGTVKLTEKPDYRYRLEYLKCLDTGQNVPTSPPIGPIAGESASDRKKAAVAHARASAALRAIRNSQGVSPDIVGRNNLAEITFQWDLNNGNDRRVFQTVRVQDKSNVLWARYNVSLNIDDPKYPLIKANGGEPVP